MIKKLITNCNSKYVIIPCDLLKLMNIEDDKVELNFDGKNVIISKPKKED